MGYCVSLRYFQESCGKRFLDEVERKDLLRLAAFLRDTKKLSPRTVHTKFADVLTFLKAQGVPKLIGKKRPSPLYRAGCLDLRRRGTVETPSGLLAVPQHALRLPTDERLSGAGGHARCLEQRPLQRKHHRNALETAVQLDTEGLQRA